MPTDYDNFTPSAMWKYQGANPAVRAHLRLLQTAMRQAGFLGLRAEWWHFTVMDWDKLMPPQEVSRAKRAFGPSWRR
jgi:D-alanyl-D-alanine dipeptidase